MPTYEIVGKMPLLASFNKVQLRKILAVLVWNKSYLKQSEKAKYIMSKLTGNATFPIPWTLVFITLIVLSGDIDALDAAILAAAGKGKGTAKILAAASLKLYNDLVNIMSMIQLAMDAKPTTAILICEGAGFDYKSQTTRGPRKNSAKRGNEPGVMLLEGEGRGGHQWEQSSDDGATYIALPPTSGGKTTVTGLKSDVRYWFHCRVVLTKGRYGDWTPWFSEVAP